MKFHHHLLLTAAWASFGLAACSREVSAPAPADSVPAMTDPSPSPLEPSMGPDIGTPPEAGEALALNATMTGREQVPAVQGTRATGTGSFSLDATRTMLRYELTHTVEAPTGAHLHLGIAGESGEVMLSLMTAPGVLSGTVPVTPEQARLIEGGRAYVDIHSAAHPDGEIRGQVVLPGEIVYVARLSADQVNPPTESASEGLGAFLVDGTTRRMRFVVNVQGMPAAPTTLFIGMGPAGVDGPMALDLADPKTPPAAALSGARSLTSTEDLDLGRWYVDVRSARFPRGEVRGQILRPGQELYLARMSGEESVPPVSSQATGSVSLIVDSDRDRVIYDVALSNIAVTEAFLGEGPVGASGASVLTFEAQGSSFRAMRMLTPDSTLLASLAAGNVYASAASEMFPDGEIRGQMRRVALPR
jgi:hypothetical protein